MTKEQWQSLEAYFQEIIKLSDDERTKALADLHDTDPDLASEVAALIEVASGNETLAEIAEDAKNLGRGENSFFSGKHLGAYRILHQLGAGGTSTVYLAVRDDGTYHRQVALKLLNPRFQTPEFLDLFHREQQILAGLSHPNIAQLLDAGHNEEGLPFLVTEYVEGTPLDTYCNRENLKIQERLEVFFKICDAVTYAHQNLIIHRDLKPGNILVTKEGEPILLDFGFAKMLNPHFSQKGTASQVWLRMLTPAYASPEQFLGHSMTTASDVYSLGVILYELLSGCRPFELKGLTREEIHQQICETLPQKPSLACRQHQPPKPGDGFGEKTAKQLKGDLDSIILKALRKEPNRRYLSVADFVEDLRRYFTQRPVLARKDSLTYRLGKYVRRNRGVLLVAAVLVALLVAYVRNQVQHAANLSQALEKARVAQRNTDEAFDYLAKLFRLPDPLEGLGGSLTAREILDRGAIQIFENLEQQPASKMKLISVMGEVYTNLGLYQEALDLLERGLPLAESTAISPMDLANYEFLLGRAAVEKGQWEDGERYLKRAYDRKVEILGKEHPDLARIILQLARVNDALGQYKESEGLLVQGEALIQNADVPDLEFAYRFRLAKARLDLYFGRYDLAIGKLSDLRTNVEKQFGEDHPLNLVVVTQLGITYKNKGDLEAAESLYRWVLKKAEDLYGSDHPKMVAQMVNLGALLHERAEFSEAESLYLKAIALGEKYFEPDHGDLLTTRANLASLYYGSKNYPKAAEQFKELVRVQAESFGVGHPNVCRTRSNLAMTLNKLGQSIEAESLFRYNLALLEDQDLENHEMYLVSIQNLGGLLVSNGDFETALPLLQKVDASMRDRGSKGIRYANNLCRLGFALVSVNQAEKAEPILTEALKIYETDLSPTDWRVSVAKSYLGHCLYYLGKKDQARSLISKSFPDTVSYLTQDHLLVRALQGIQRDLGISAVTMSDQR